VTLPPADRAATDCGGGRASRRPGAGGGWWAPKPPCAICASADAAAGGALGGHFCCVEARRERCGNRNLDEACGVSAAANVPLSASPLSFECRRPNDNELPNRIRRAGRRCGC
jgi:hypothetical protein